MRFSDLSALIGLSPDILPEGTFSGVTADSRIVAAGDLFVAVPGSKVDGVAFAADAAAKGAVAILCGPDAEVSADAPVIRAEDPRRALALIAAKLHGPQPETMVAVTGTAGKTSVAAFTRQIFARAGLKAAAIGTTGVIAPGIAIEGALTTPDPVRLHQILADLSAAGITHGAMEASSHGLDQRRLDGVELAAAGFTNLGRDHLDYHSDMEDYFASKMRLFDTLLGAGKPAVIFADDAWSDRAIGAARDAGCDILTVGRKGTFIALKRVEHERHKQVLELVHNSVTHRIVLPLAGDFQVANALVSAGLAIAAGVAPDIAFAALEHLEGAPGRLDLVGTAKNGAVVYVDYAHKPEALEQVLLSVRPFTTGKVAVVFGCGGDRDPGKRPIMGEIAGRLADLVYVTDDNPRSEDPAAIRAAIMEAVRGATEIGDRREAIRTAVAALATGDTLVVAGKGHETGQTAGGVTRPFSDHNEARAALSEVAA
jgi:UDP-N-acetylmuramoyl-L-alanyl-D-glutamate--2,6-diaminopimelate ligase